MGQPVRLLPWQKGLIKEVWNPQGVLKKRKILISSCRKTGKSSLISMLLLSLCFRNPEDFCEIPLLSSSFEQSKLGLFRILKEFLEISPFKKECKSVEG